MTNTPRIGMVRIYREVVTSTSDVAMSLIHQGGVQEGTVVWADYQTAGRGQRMNAWESQRGENLLLSVIMSPMHLSLSQAFMLNRVASLAVSDTLSELGILSISIKWPNDVLVDQQKIAGVLIQNTSQGDRIRHTVMGIGLNINQDAFSPELTQATSLKMLTQRQWDRGHMMDRLLAHLDRRYRQSEIEADVLAQEYQERLDKRDVWQIAYFDRVSHRVRIKRTHLDGRLEVELESGKMRSFAHREIIFAS